MAKLPWYIKVAPAVTPTLTGDLAIEDHLGRSDIQVGFWSNGEGFTISIESDGAKQPPRELELTWQEWDGVKRLLRAMREREREDEAKARKRNA